LVRPNPNNVLRALLNKRLIKKYHIDTWNELRNPIAHGKIIEFKDYQKYLTLCYKCQSLFNLLIFLLIEYQGYYNDFSQYGFKMKSFKKSITRVSSGTL